MQTAHQVCELHMLQVTGREWTCTGIHSRHDQERMCSCTSCKQCHLWFWGIHSCQEVACDCLCRQPSQQRSCARTITLPKPMTARVLPTMETPTYLVRSHLPAFTEASACATLRLSAQMSAMPCSAAATVLAVGAFTTRHPCCAAGHVAVRLLLYGPVYAVHTELRQRFPVKGAPVLYKDFPASVIYLLCRSMYVHTSHESPSWRGLLMGAS